MEINKILSEDLRRRNARRTDYNPVIGDETDPLRCRVTTSFADMPHAYVPKTMVDDPEYTLCQKNFTAWQKLRCRHDFEYWCAVCVTIKHKTLGRDKRLILNAPQRTVVATLEADRRARRPIRLIQLKARQWGGSTLVQTYMAWIQSCHCRNWHSIICSQVKDTSTGIRGMYTKLLENYPADLWDGDEPPRFRPYERSTNVREISGRGCRVTVSSIENQDAVRGADFAMAHLSETAFWRATPGHSPADVIRAICGSIALIPNSLIAIESTANGVGNFFHSEWMRCNSGKGDKHAIFVPWYEIEIYRLDPPDRVAFANSLTDYEWQLWNKHQCALDQIYWYRSKSLEYANHEKMMAEFPTTPDEAFAATSSAVFARLKVEDLRKGCQSPKLGEFERSGWTDDPLGKAKLWQLPTDDGEYIVSVDIGGRTERADYSVIAVLRTDTPKPEVVAQWRGHIDHDLLARRAETIAGFYNEALLIVESNSLENSIGIFILDSLADTYSNLYRRRVYDDVARNETSRIGFHTNRATKEMIISNLVAMVREGGYIERDEDACNELLTYEQCSDGTYAAKPGCHDDIVMSRAIALHVASHSESRHIPKDAITAYLSARSIF